MQRRNNRLFLQRNYRPFIYCAGSMGCPKSAGRQNFQ